MKKTHKKWHLFILRIFIIICSIVSLFILLDWFLNDWFFNDFLTTAKNSKESEARGFIHYSNRAQQAYFLENRHFVYSFDESKVINTYYINPDNYSRSMKNLGNVVFTYTTSRNHHLKSFVGVVFISSKGNLTTGVCKTIYPSQITAPDPIIKDDKIICADGTEDENIYHY